MWKSNSLHKTFLQKTQTVNHFAIFKTKYSKVSVLIIVPIILTQNSHKFAINISTQLLVRGRFNK
jgi:hypothetical protein